MKKNKKLFWLTAIAIVGTFGLVACETTATPDDGGSVDTSTIKLADFDDQTASVSLGDEYILPALVKDEAGKEYAVTYSVKTQSGKSVGTIDGVFWVDRFETYSVLCSVALSETDIRTRTLTLNVQDKGAPELTFASFEDGTTGVEYTLPNITVNDNSGEVILPNAKLYKLHGAMRGEEVSVTEGKFTPSEGGYYLYEATAIDGSGNTATASEILYFCGGVKTTDLLTFDEPEYMDRLDLGANKTSTWLSEYAGEQGVAQISYMGQEWEPQFKFAPMKDVSSATSTLLTAYDSVIVRMYVEQSAQVTNYWKYVAMRDGSGSDTRIDGVVYNRWVDYRFPVSAITDAQEYAAKVYGRATQLYEADGTTKKNHKGVFYLSDVFVANEATVSVSGNLQSGATLSIGAEYAGNGVDLSHADITVITPEGASVKLTNAQYTPTSRGKYTVYVKADGYWGTAEFDITGVERADELISFDYAGDLSYVENSAAREESWISSFAGEQGVFRTEYVTSGNWVMQFTFKPLQDISESASIYDDYNYVVLKMYIVQNETYQSNWQYVFINTSSTSYHSPTAVQTNTWVEYKFDIDLLKYNAEKIKFGGKEVSTPTDGSEQKGLFYVADISLAV
ncbi:MAG: hypothetical protein IJ514_05810 [Clostridia bacterium]|nr:hypothetical protein [Clostridia bacterium]